MAKAHLYELTIKSAATTGTTDAFIAEQKKITTAVKRDIKKALAEKGLSAEFSFAAKRVPNTSRSAAVYATPKVVQALKEVRNVENVRKMVLSIYPPSKSI